jgi:hypothetical protein
MNEKQAEIMAEALRGRTWQSGGDIWLVLIDKKDGKLVVISEEVICEYNNEDNFDKSNPAKTIFLQSA